MPKTISPAEMKNYSCLGGMEVKDFSKQQRLTQAGRIKGRCKEKLPPVGKASATHAHYEQ